MAERRHGDGHIHPLSALQHYLFCPRQCALIHVEQAWAENRLTAEGRVLHEATSEVGAEKRRGVRVVTAMPLVSRRLGVSGIADLVEMHKDERRPMAALPGRVQARQTQEHTGRTKCNSAPKPWRWKRCSKSR